MDYRTILKNFTIDLETIPTSNVGFYDIWEIRPELERLEKNLKKMPLTLRIEYENQLKKLYDKLEKISLDKKDPLVKEEVNLLKEICYRHKVAQKELV